MIWCVEDDASIRDIEVYALQSTGLIYKAGASDRLGKTAEGTTVCDYDPEGLCEIVVRAQV